MLFPVFLSTSLRRSPAVRYSFIRLHFEVVLRITHEKEYFRGRLESNLRDNDRPFRFDPKKYNLSRSSIETFGSFSEGGINWATGVACYWPGGGETSHEKKRLETLINVRQATVCFSDHSMLLVKLEQ